MSTDSKTLIVSFKDGALKHCSRNSELHLECGSEFKFISAEAGDLKCSLTLILLNDKPLKKKPAAVSTLSREQSNVLRMCL